MDVILADVHDTEITETATHHVSYQPEGCTPHCFTSVSLPWHTVSLAQSTDTTIATKYT